MVDVDAAQTPGPQGVPGRVAEAQAQTRPTLVLVAVYLLAAAVAGAVPQRTGRWLPLHLALAGALVLAVSGATQFLAVTWGAGPAPRRGPVAVQRWLAVAEAALVAVGTRRGRHATLRPAHARPRPSARTARRAAFQGPATAHAAPSSCRSNSTEYCVMLSGSSWLSGCDPGGPRPPTTEARRR